MVPGGRRRDQSDRPVQSDIQAKGCKSCVLLRLRRRSVEKSNQGSDGN